MGQIDCMAALFDQVILVDIAPIISGLVKNHGIIEIKKGRGNTNEMTILNGVAICPAITTDVNDDLKQIIRPVLCLDSQMLEYQTVRIINQNGVLRQKIILNQHTACILGF